jgi:hypothetical protein
MQQNGIKSETCGQEGQTAFSDVHTGDSLLCVYYTHFYLMHHFLYTKRFTQNSYALCWRRKNACDADAVHIIALSATVKFISVLLLYARELLR